MVRQLQRERTSEKISFEPLSENSESLSWRNNMWKTIPEAASFVLCSVHGTFIIRLHIHISNASSRRISSFYRVHVSLPYSATLQTNAFTIRFCKLKLRVRDPRMSSLFLLKPLFPKAISLLTSWQLLQSSSSIRSRQLLNCLALRLLIWPNVLPWLTKNPTMKAKGYILLKKGQRQRQKALSFLRKGQLFYIGVSYQLRI